MKTYKLSADAIRFVIGGVLNTAFTYLIFILALKVTHYDVAYFISWATGIIIVVTMYPSKIFIGSNASTKKRLLTGFQYISVFFIGLIILKVLIEYFLISKEISMLITISFTTVINFLLMRLILRGGI